jgi:hypothetical protein
MAAINTAEGRRQVYTGSTAGESKLYGALGFACILLKELECHCFLSLYKYF